MSPSCQSPHTDVSRSVKNKKTHYACKIHIAGEIFFVIQMAFHIILPSSFKKPCRMWLQKMTSILSKCLFSQVAEMTWPLRHPFKSCFRTRSQWCWCALGSWQPPGGKNGANLCHREVHATIGLCFFELAAYHGFKDRRMPGQDDLVKGPKDLSPH